VSRPDNDVPREIAQGVHYLTVGKGLLRANIYFVRSDTAWVLIDAGSAGCGPAIVAAAEALFGEGTCPTAILLTHDHPDHGGAVKELVQKWDCPVWVHPDEEPIVQGGIPQFHQWASPLDRWVVLPWMRLLGRKRAEAMVAQASLKGLAYSFDFSAGVPGLPGWEALHTPGHTPGHVAFFRRSDRVLLTGDALVTMNVNSLAGLVAGKQTASAPPWYVSWDMRLAKKSIAALAKLEPLVVGGGHGVPLSGSEVPGKVEALAARVAAPVAAPEGGR
jgi:glyoxylase-like metal-dependent hydrolase (beta-lactamase superfamily II)